MNYQSKRTAYGIFMFNITLHASRFLIKHMWLYYILSYTWGIITTIVGWVVLGFIRLFLRNKVVDYGKFGPCHYAMLGNNWGGLELGTNFILADNMGTEWTLHTKQHEIWGPLAIFLIFIPSCTRYWLDRAGKLKLDYEAIWFEGNASTIGQEYYTHLK